LLKRLLHSLTLGRPGALSIRCPTCSSDAVAAFHVWSAGTATPARCGACATAAVLNESRVAVFVRATVYQILLLVGLLLTFVWWSWIPATATVALLGAAEVLRIRFGGLRVVSADEEIRAARSVLWGLVVIVVLVVLAGVLAGVLGQ
jgi:hypothetical protein